MLCYKQYQNNCFRWSCDIDIHMFLYGLLSTTLCRYWTTVDTFVLAHTNILLPMQSIGQDTSPCTPPPPAPSGPKFSNSENCCGSENAMPPKIFWDMEGHRAFQVKKRVFFSKNIFWKKILINHTIFLNFRYAFFQILML